MKFSTKDYKEITRKARRGILKWEVLSFFVGLLSIAVITAYSFPAGWMDPALHHFWSWQHWVMITPVMIYFIAFTWWWSNAVDGILRFWDNVLWSIHALPDEGSVKSWLITSKTATIYSICLSSLENFSEHYRRLNKHSAKLCGGG